MIWLIGVGNMGREYAKVLSALDREFIAIGRGDSSAREFEQATGHPVATGGLTQFLSNKPSIPEAVIVAVGVAELSSTTMLLLDYGIKNILLEKPGFGPPDEAKGLAKATGKAKADVLLAYNRRFYSSVLAAEKIIHEDGGIVSFNFEFTEWIHTLRPEDYAALTMRYWVLANSSHVIDTAFFLGGQPAQISCYTAGKDALPWHPSASVFFGSGRSENGALFGYQASWQSPGRWAVEILTNKHRLYFKPMETLQIQEKGSVHVSSVEIDDRLDKEFKPGLYLQTKAFLEGDYTRFCTIEQQAEHVERYYKKIGNYK